MSLSLVHCRSVSARSLFAALALAGFAAVAVPALASSPTEPLPPAPSVPSGAFAEGAFDGTEDRASARLLVDVVRAQPGETIRVGVLFDLDPGWHIYWRSPGSSGLPTELLWQQDRDAGIEIGGIEWPTPGTFDESEGLIVTYGYTGRVLLPAKARVAHTASGAVELAVEARFLVCEIACVPGEIELSRTLAVAQPGQPHEAASQRVVALFDSAAASKPLALAAYGLEATVLYSQSAVRPGDRFEAAISLGCQGRADCTAPESGEAALGYAFIPDLIEGLDVSVTQTSAHPLSPGDLLIELRGTAGAAAPEAEQRLSGIASLTLPDGRSVAAEIDLPLPRAAVGSEITSIGTPWRIASAGTSAAPVASISLWRAILFALLGGLILNLMPCVLPVLAIKVFAIAELAHSNRREVLASGAAYTAGIVASMLLLAAAVIGLRAGGAAIGWGFQFQEPLFVAAICAVLVVFALNLFGVFEIFAATGSLGTVGATGSPTRRSFFEGLLAVVLATPCSAPFLGPAVGFAFAGTPVSIVAIFVAIGLGLASPFVAITLVPAWARFLPRSGPWMLTLRSALGFAVLAPVVWLLWVVGQQVGNDGVAALLSFLVAIAFGAWLFGIFQARGSAAIARAVALASLGAALFGMTQLPLEATEEATQRAHEPTATGEAGAAVYSRAALTRALEQGSPVFVYFTADWCITCKVNERTTLADARVRSAFSELAVTVLVADWTRRDAAIAHELARFGRAGVPLYLVYDARKPEAPTLLPELLTPGILIEALQAATRS